MPSKFAYGPTHTNSSVICALDVRIGSVDPVEMIEICMIPLNHSFKMNTQMGLFNLRLRPAWPVDLKVAKLNKETHAEFMSQSVGSTDAFGFFEHWIRETVKLKPRKQIIPLCFGWDRIKPALIEWAGLENFKYYFSNAARDLMGVLNFVNDRCSVWNEEIPFVRPTFRQLLRRSGITLADNNSIPANCKALIDVYNILLARYIPG